MSVVTPLDSSYLINPGSVLNHYDKPLCAMQDCVVVDLKKDLATSFCILLQWKFFGLGVSSGSLSLSFPLIPSQSLS